jgi:drug/metabolite transporter (DMT)-like permease
MAAWFLIALIPPLLHASVNHIDKHLIAKYLKGGEVGSLVLFSALFAVVALPVVVWIDPAVLSISRHDAVLLMINGGLLVGAYICYFYALNKDEASIVVPLFQLTPLFSFGLGYFFLGELLSQAQIIGSLIIIVGAIVLSLELKHKNFKLKRMVLLLMVGSSMLYAINGVLFKFVAVSQQRFWPSLFWDFLGKVLFGLLIFFTISSYRQQFLRVLKENKQKILALNGLNEILAIVGEGVGAFATLLAPVVLVQVVSGFQPLFVFVYGILLTLLWPSFANESLATKNLVQKMMGITFIIIGTVIIN